jgi:hypothetical protein
MGRYWQEYWFDIDLRDARSPVFEPLGPEPPRQMPNVVLRDSSLAVFADDVLAEAMDELSDLTGELRVRVYDTPAPGPDTEPVLERRGELRGR